MPPAVAEAANTLIGELYESTESLGITLTNTSDTDVSVLTAQRFYGRIPSTPVEMVLDYWYNDFTTAGLHILRSSSLYSFFTKCSGFARRFDAQSVF